MGAGLVVGPAVTMYRAYREESELLDKGVWVTGVITEKHLCTNSRSHHQWEVNFQFISEKGTQRKIGIDDSENRLQVGDSLDILYLPEFPKISRTYFELELQ